MLNQRLKQTRLLKQQDQTRITAKEVRRQLIEQKGYKETDFCESSIENKLNDLGYKLKSIQKTASKKIPETFNFWKSKQG